MKKFESYVDKVSRLFLKDDTFNKKLTRTVTFQVTDGCNLACKYCYQINKGKRAMSFETAKKFVDLVLSGEKGFHNYISYDNSEAIILEFIGGEPLLEVELIDKICDYFMTRAIEMMHPWAENMMISICSNGTLYKDPKVQRFLNKWKYRLSFSITIDGNKELHDSCRVFPDGSPSYDLAVEGAKDWISKGGYMGSKITIAPENVQYLEEAIIHMMDLGYTEINVNCVYEKGWTTEHAKELYKQMKSLSNYFIDNKIDFEHDMFCSLYNEDYFKPKKEHENDNWCGGNGQMISVDPDGIIFPCIRYMESSLGTDQEPYSIGDVDKGICQTECDKCRVDCLSKITRRSQSTDECFYCPIAEGCSWCTAYNYQIFGTPDKRATYICAMHKARALANYYFWNLYYRTNGIGKRMEVNIPKEWALEIISEEEYNMILSLSKEE